MKKAMLKTFVEMYGKEALMNMSIEELEAEEDIFYDQYQLIRIVKSFKEIE